MKTCSRRAGRTPAVRSVKGPSPERTATDEVRRERPFVGRRPAVSSRPKADPRRRSRRLRLLSVGQRAVVRFGPIDPSRHVGLSRSTLARWGWSLPETAARLIAPTAFA